ncbi:MAG: tubulin-like doman-containing protein, partial [Chloroherpetonaceae bacterium]
MIKPALYVGLGGAGIWTVANIKNRILKREDELGVKFPNTYLVLDTDEGTIQNVKAKFGSDILNDATETVIYGKTCNPRREYEKMLQYHDQGRLMQAPSVHRSMAKWIDEQVARKFPNDSLSKGASAERQKGRVGGLFSKQEIMNKLRHQIRSTTNLIFEYQQRYREQSSQNDFSFPIYLISSCLGGSGSSMFLDVCKMISLIYRDVVAQSKGSGEADIQPIIYLPDPYLEKYQMGDPSLILRYKANAFAFFSEIDFFFHDRYFVEKGKEGKRIYDLFFDSEDDEVKLRRDLSWQPFKAGVLIDSQLVSVQFKDITQMYEIVAEMIAQLCTTPTAYNAIQSKFDNQKGQIGINHDIDEDKSLKLARAYATMGYRVLEFPKEPVRRYFFYRFRAEMFEGLIGKNYDHIQDTAFREEELLAKVEQLERFIYADLANKSNTLDLNNNNKIPHNLEAALIREAIQPLIDNFSITRFYTEKALEKGKEDFEKKKVSESELSAHFEEAKNLIQNFRSRANQVLDGTGPNSRQGIIAALKEELDQIFVDAVMTFGVNYAKRLLERIDATLENELTHALTTYRNKRAEQEKMGSEVVRLKSEVTNEAEKMFGSKWKEKLKEYHTKVSDFIDIAREEYLLEVRIKLLEYLCKGEDGLLDKYERQAFSLLQLLTTYYDGNNSRKGFRHEFETALLKEFQNTASLLTVQYLPNISEYVSPTGEWKDETLLTRLYERFIAIQKQSGEDRNKPIRYYVDELPSANQNTIPKDRLPSLFKRLSDILNRFGKDNFL